MCIIVDNGGQMTKTVKVTTEVHEYLDELLDSGVVPVSNRRLTYNDAIRYLINEREEEQLV